MISGTFYTNDIRYIMHDSGPLTVAEIKTKLLGRNVKLDEAQILEAIDVLMHNKQIQRSTVAGKFVKVRVSK